MCVQVATAYGEAVTVCVQVHLGHMYVEAGEASREGKLNMAATNMGVTVVAGGVTTFGSAIFMYACQLSFFSKMATLIAGTVAFSLLLSLLLFMPLCAVFGPEGDILTVREQLVRCGRRLTRDAPRGAPVDGGDTEMVGRACSAGNVDSVGSSAMATGTTC